MPDTLDGRFAVLATVTALVLVRLESDGEAGDAVSVALTERFIEVMEVGASRAWPWRPDARQDGPQAGRLAGAADRAVALGDRRDRDGRERRESLYKADAGRRWRSAIRRSALKRLWATLERATGSRTRRGKI